MRDVNNPIEPVSPYKSAPGFFNIAHRGASYYAPENTMPAFKLAVEMNADMIELDITLTRDGIPVVFHDQKLDRTTNGTGNIQHFLSRELGELDAGLWLNKEFTGTRIPTLENVLEWASGTIALNIEIKKEAILKSIKPGIAEITCELVEQFGMTDQVVISSFSDEALIKSRNASPKIPTAHLINPYSWGSKRNLKLMKKLGAVGLNLKHRQMRSRLMKQAELDKYPVWVYTVDDKEEMKKVIEKGATGIFTNRPDVLSKVASSVLVER